MVGRRQADKIGNVLFTIPGSITSRFTIGLALKNRWRVSFWACKGIGSQDLSSPVFSSNNFSSSEQIYAQVGFHFF